ncbi:unnamed protein product [Clavelina lepadiformis]|uniref:Aromatic amino acid beta-eliminating lyase/threonine aldolase domain-containing protein n=1 Tax=Clavelina lepadiformis TaxID=159417 RepID=A0ABP0GK43_CLALP
MANVRTIDIRSDTVTQPTQEMREAMLSAEVGDDVYGEDPTVNRLQAIAAEMFGKEDALFVPTGTMGNLISILAHCQERGSEVLLGNHSHIYIYEQGGIAQLGGVVPRPLRNLPDGTFDLEELRYLYNPGTDPHRTKSAVVAIENTICGKVIPIEFMAQVKKVANELNIPVHLDGARMFNAVTALNIEPTELTKHVDSLNVCLSKGLCAPVGSIIAGKKDFITRAKRLRKVLGGGMRQSGVLASPGIIALTKMSKRLQHDHNKAKKFGKALLELRPDVFKLNLDEIQTNMVLFGVDPANFLKNTSNANAVKEFCARMKKPTSDCPVSVELLAYDERNARAVFHNDVSDEDFDLIIIKLHHVLKE